MATVLMAIEGVLTEDLSAGSDLLHYESSNQGKVLYNLFRDSARLVLLSTDPSKDRVKAWMARERFTRYADIHCYPIDTLLTPPLWRVQHTKDLVGVGHHISFYVDSDPTAVALALEAGVGAMLVGRPGDSPGKRGDDTAYQPWYALVDSIERQNMLRASRTAEATDA